MRKLVKKLSMLLLILSAVGLIPIQSIEAAAYTLKFTGKLGDPYIPPGEYVGDPNLKPILKKDKDGVYTLTMYDGCIAAVGVKTTADIRALPLKESKYIKVKTSHPDYIDISTDGIGGKKTLKETLTFQLKDTSEYLNGKKNPNYGKRVGPELKINIVVKALPDEKWVSEWDKTLEEINVSEDATDLEKVTAVYNWITSNIKYEYDTVLRDNDGWKHALVHKEARCGGYARLFSELAQAVGLEVWEITGPADGAYGWQNHAWNIVKVDKKWYMVDATWDAGAPAYRYFLKSEASFASTHKAEGAIVSKVNMSKTDYNLPDSAFRMLGETYLKMEKADYAETKVLLAKGLDNYLAVELEDFEEEDIDEDTIEIYTELYQYKVEKYAADFYAWLGFPSDEAYIEYMAYETKYTSMISGLTYTKEEKEKALEDYYKKYPKTQ